MDKQFAGVALIASVCLTLSACSGNSSKNSNTTTDTSHLNKSNTSKKVLSADLLCPAMERICSNNQPAKLVFQNKTCKMVCPED